MVSRGKLFSLANQQSAIRRSADAPGDVRREGVSAEIHDASLAAGERELIDGVRRQGLLQLEAERARVGIVARRCHDGFVGAENHEAQRLRPKSRGVHRLGEGNGQGVCCPSRGNARGRGVGAANEARAAPVSVIERVAVTRVRHPQHQARNPDNRRVDGVRRTLAPKDRRCRRFCGHRPRARR